MWGTLRCIFLPGLSKVRWACMSRGYACCFQGSLSTYDPRVGVFYDILLIIIIRILLGPLEKNSGEHLSRELSPYCVCKSWKGESKMQCYLSLFFFLISILRMYYHGYNNYCNYNNDYFFCFSGGPHLAGLNHYSWWCLLDQMCWGSNQASCMQGRVSTGSRAPGKSLWSTVNLEFHSFENSSTVRRH